MDKEIWKDVVDYEGRYQVSNMGRVKSLVDSHGKFREKILSLSKHGNGYLVVVLCKCGRHKVYCVHRLVLSTFNPMDNMENLECNHRDENKENNNLSNLEWTTHKENCNHGTRIARMAEKKSILIVQLTLDGKLVNVYKSSKEAERGGFNQGNIIQCCKNKFNREDNNIYKGYKWQYLSEYIHNIDPRIKKVILFDKEYQY